MVAPVTVRVYLHSIFRDLAPAGQDGFVEVHILAGGTLRNALRQLGVDRVAVVPVVVVNGRAAPDLDMPLLNGDEAHLFSPVSGG